MMTIDKDFNLPHSMRLSQLPGTVWLLMTGAVRRMLRLSIRPLFASCGKNVSFNPFDDFYYRTIHIGNDVFIGSGACFTAIKGITIGNKVMFGPNVTIRGGNHNASVRNRFMYDVHEKRPEDDKSIIIEDDVWIGAGAIILKGATVKRGSIVAAGSVVTRVVEPYSIVAGIPATVVRYRWSVEEIMEHEISLYAIENRLSETILRSGRNDLNDRSFGE